nr:MAG TPA: hypothetical protein [Caudoviricetes sp.]
MRFKLTLGDRWVGETKKIFLAHMRKEGEKNGKK